MYAESECAVQLWQTGKKDNGPVSGIHFEIKQHFQVIQNRISDIVRFIYDDNRCLSLFKDESVDLILYDLEVIRFFWKQAVRRVQKQDFDRNRSR